MGNYFVPNLDPSQVYTASEYLVSSGQRILPTSKESVIEADRMTAVDERVKFAFLTTFSVDGGMYSGVAMATTHGLCCCSSVNHNFIGVKIPYAEDFAIGKVTGLLSKKVSIGCERVTVEISGTAQRLNQLVTSLQQAQFSLRANPVKKRETATVIRKSAAQQKATEKIKAGHRSERRLSKAETAAFGKCPSCGGTVLVEKSGIVVCYKCQKNLGSLK